MQHHVAYFDYSLSWPKCNIMLHFLFECPCFGYGREQRYTRRFILGEGVLGERRCAGKSQRWCCWPARRRASGHWQNEIVLRSQGTRWRDASHLDGVNCYKAFSTDPATLEVKLSFLPDGMVLRSRMSMVTLPLVITKP